jgi:hypothetical protein
MDIDVGEALAAHVEGNTGTKFAFRLKLMFVIDHVREFGVDTSGRHSGGRCSSMIGAHKDLAHMLARCMQGWSMFRASLQHQHDRPKLVAV